MPPSFVSSSPQVSDYNIVTSKDQRNQAGISAFEYVDAYNSAQMAQYNNDYQYWMKQQEQAYNSPVEQRKRLEEAGLNPNFNSIDGTGNVRMDASNQQVAQNIGSNRNAAIGNAINAFNSIIKAIGEGVNIYSQIAQTPSDVSGYRDMLSQMMAAGLSGKELDNTKKATDVIFDSFVNGLWSTKDINGDIFHQLVGGTYPHSAQLFFSQDELDNMATSLGFGQRLLNYQGQSFLNNLRGLQVDKLSLFNKYYGQNLEKGLDLLDQKIELLKQQGKLTSEQAEMFRSTAWAQMIFGGTRAFASMIPFL